MRGIRMTVPKEGQMDAKLIKVLTYSFSFLCVAAGAWLVVNAGLYVLDYLDTGSPAMTLHRVLLYVPGGLS